MMRRLFRYGLTALTAVLLAACSDETDSLYSSQRAFFRYSAVSTTPQLYTALHNPGMFCSVSFPTGRYVFTDADGHTFTYTPTAVDNYTRPECVAGFIIGTPALPDASGGFPLTAYDLVCRNCDHDHAIRRALVFASATTMRCGRCGRTYDLNNGGIVCNGPGGKTLYRYRISYNEAGNTVVVQN